MEAGRGAAYVWGGHTVGRLKRHIHFRSGQSFGPAYEWHMGCLNCCLYYAWLIDWLLSQKVGWLMKVNWLIEYAWCMVMLDKTNHNHISPPLMICRDFPCNSWRSVRVKRYVGHFSRQIFLLCIGLLTIVWLGWSRWTGRCILEVVADINLYRCRRCHCCQHTHRCHCCWAASCHCVHRCRCREVSVQTAEDCDAPPWEDMVNRF